MHCRLKDGWQSRKEVSVMKIKRLLSRIMGTGLSLLLLIQFSGCGTLLYPERRGQHSGRLDIGIMILDGVGLIFFIIPGLIAYGVDFTTGAIYLPGGHARGSLSTGREVRVIVTDEAGLSQAKIDAIVARETGIAPRTLGMGTKMSYAVDSREELIARVVNGN